VGCSTSLAEGENDGVNDAPFSACALCNARRGGAALRRHCAARRRLLIGGSPWRWFRRWRCAGAVGSTLLRRVVWRATRRATLPRIACRAFGYLCWLPAGDASAAFGSGMTRWCRSSAAGGCLFCAGAGRHVLQGRRDISLLYTSGFPVSSLHKGGGCA